MVIIDTTGLLQGVIVIFGAAVLVLFVCQRINIPSIVGFLLTGILIGPYGIGLIESVDAVHAIAEIGVILLLFSIGLEFSFKSLINIRNTILLGGSLQVGLTILFTFIVARFMDLPANQCIFLGFLVSLSSTAIVLKQLAERLEMDTPQGKIALGILIFQDIIVVAMMLVTPWLGSGTADLNSVWMVLIKAAGLIAAIILASIYILPPLMYQITRTQSRELFLLSTIVICFSIAWLTSAAGLSLALGAFLAGLIIAESEYSQQALASVIPFIDTFTSLFFVSIGMLLSLESVLDNFGIILLFTLLLIVLKGLVAAVTAIIMGYPLRISLLVGFSLCQIGEFSFILAQTGRANGLMGAELYQGFLAASIFTMMLSPFLIYIGPKVAFRMSKLPLPVRILSGRYPWAVDIEEDLQQENHLIIVGYGVNGRNLARAASYAGIPYVILEINAETVRTEQEKGEPIYYGDASHQAVLDHVKIEQARVIVIAISDPRALRRITLMVRKINPTIYIIVRTRMLADVHDLRELGADMVIPEEYETSIEIFARVLDRYMVPTDKIEEFISIIRSENYEMFRTVSLPSSRIRMLRQSLSDMELSRIEVATYSKAAGKTISQLDIRKNHGATILAVNRGKEYIANPNAEFTIEAGDYLILIGKPEQIRNVAKDIRTPESPQKGSA